MFLDWRSAGVGASGCVSGDDRSARRTLLTYARSLDETAFGRSRARSSAEPQLICSSRAKVTAAQRVQLCHGFVAGSKSVEWAATMAGP